MKPLLDYDDAVQECAAAFAYTIGYAQRNGVDNAAWFMALFKTAVAQSFATLAIKNIRARSFYAEPVENLDKIEYSEGILFTALNQASEELRTVLSIIASSPSEFLDLVLKQANDRKWSRRVLRLCGIYDVKVDVIGELRTLLQKD